MTGSSDLVSRRKPLTRFSCKRTLSGKALPSAKTFALLLATEELTLIDIGEYFCEVCLVYLLVVIGTKGVCFHLMIWGGLIGAQKWVRRLFGLKL